MLPRKLTLPDDHPLPTEKVAEGLYVVTGAYAKAYGYDDTSRLYVRKEPSPRARGAAPPPEPR
jgi:hypothetical protein